jgi:hypothetical protein
MSYDLQLWHAPTLFSYDEALARIDGPGAPPSDEARAALEACLQALLTLETLSQCWSVPPRVDLTTGTLGLCVNAHGVEPLFSALEVLGPKHGLVWYDLQDGVVHYTDGSTSRDEQNDAEGVHEGVAVCLRELSAHPPLAASVQLDALSALTQFVLVDSLDEAAATGRAIPVLVALAKTSEGKLPQQAAGVLAELCDELRERRKTPPLEPETLVTLKGLMASPDPERQRVALAMLGSLAKFARA